MSRRKAASLILIRTPDGLVVSVDSPDPALLKAVLALIAHHVGLEPGQEPRQ